MRLTTEELQWLAGLLEGEGSFLPGPPSRPTTPYLSMEMCDRDVIGRAARLMNIGHIHEYRRHLTAGHKVSYKILQRGPRAVALMRAVLPLMGNRQSRDIERAIACYRRLRRRMEPPQIRGNGNTERGTPWLAGLLEGEGTFVRVTSKNPTVSVSCEMSDRDVIEAVSTLIGATSVTVVDTERKRRRGWSVTYKTAIRGGRAVELMKLIHPVMGERRRGQIDAALASWPGYERLVGPPPVCVVEGCTRPHRSRGLCNAHYMTWHRYRRAGRPLPFTPLR